MGARYNPCDVELVARLRGIQRELSEPIELVFMLRSVAFVLENLPRITELAADGIEYQRLRE